MASAPFHIQLGPADIWYAPTGEAFTDVDTPPAGNWELLADAENITEEGITIRGNADVAIIRSLGTIAAIKAGLVARDFEINCAVMDMRAEAIALAFGADPADITDTPAGVGTPGHRDFDLPIDPVPQGFALLVRWDQSGYADALASQIQIPSAVQLGAGDMTWSKSNPNAQPHRWTALKVAGQPLARLVVQDTVAS